MSLFLGKTLMITGGTGSFGNAVLNRFLQTDIGEIRIFSRDEKKQDDMRHDLQARYPEYANKVKEALQDKEVRVEVDDRAEKIGYKIREAQLQKVPYMLVVGDKEQEAVEVGVRNRKDGDVGAMKLEDFVEKIDEEIKTFAK